MDRGPLHERLRRARTACGEDLGALSRRTGIRLHHLRAIEDGRFHELPPGIYARATVRAFAAACGLDASAVLAECDDQLARKSGLPPRASAGPAPPASHEPDDSPWRTLAAAALDAACVGTILALVVLLTALVARVPVHALAPAAPTLAVVGAVLGSAYFFWFGGLCGITPGRAALHHQPYASDGGPLTLRTMAARALRAATVDARAPVDAGLMLARRRPTPDAASRNAPRRERALWRLRPRGRVPALWLPANPSGAAPPQPLPPPRG
jgi:helix-turn-helix protein/RDD family protein